MKIILASLLLFASLICEAGPKECIKPVPGTETRAVSAGWKPGSDWMAVAEDIQKVHAICVRCGSPANHSHRLTASEQLVVLGEKDSYEPLCRHCYNAAIAAK